MKLEYIKIILFIVAFIFPLILLANKSLHSKNFKFIRMLILIHLVLLFVLLFKLHHLLLDWFNIPNTFTYLISSIPFVLLLINFRKQLYSSETILLILSLIFFGISVLIDLLTDGKIIQLPASDNTEEYLRIIGAVFWVIYNFYFFIRFKKNRIT